MARALLLENPHSNADAVLEAAGLTVERHTAAMSEDELIDALHGVSVLGIRSQSQVTQRVLDAHPTLDAIGAFCIGTNQIDLEAASRHGIAVFNAPFSNTRSVVEMAISEIIALTRRLTVRNLDLHNGIWKKSASGAHEVRGRTLGIVGYGNIGTQLSVLAEALGMRVIFYDIAEKLALGNARRVFSLEALLEEADVVSLHVDGRPGNAGMIGAKEFATMRPGTLFVNLSRGFLVDVDALAESIQSGHIAGAALDVFPTEPAANGEPFDSVLRELPNVILTPHIGGSTEEAQESIGLFTSGKLARYYQYGNTSLSVNLPTLSQAQSSPTATHRIAYLHRNTPGVLARVNNALAETGANIEAQTLATRGDVGYVVTDIKGVLCEDAMKALRALDDTIRLRKVQLPPAV